VGFGEVRAFDANGSVGGFVSPKWPRLIDCDLATGSNGFLKSLLRGEVLLGVHDITP